MVIKPATLTLKKTSYKKYFFIYLNSFKKNKVFRNSNSQNSENDSLNQIASHKVPSVSLIPKYINESPYAIRSAP